MQKKGIISKLNSQKGITTAEVMIALLIIVSTIGVIGMIYINLNTTTVGVDRKTGASRIATNVIENINMLFYDQVQERLDNLVANGDATKQDAVYTVIGEKNIKVFGTSIPKGYTLALKLENTYGSQETVQYDLVKKLSLNVSYLLNGATQNVSLSTILQRESIKECNSPNFEEDYIRQMVPQGTEYIIFNENVTTAQAGVKIICPIQFDNLTEQYKVIEKTEEDWYSYSNKEWARVLVLDATEFASVIDFNKKVVKDTAALNGNKAYVWVPRFGIKAEGNVFGDTFFKYQDTDFAIMNSYENDGSLIYNYLDENIIWATLGIEFESNKLLGKWSQYSELATSGTEGYILNNSQVRANEINEHSNLW